MISQFFTPTLRCPVFETDASFWKHDAFMELHEAYYFVIPLRAKKPPPQKKQKTNFLLLLGKYSSSGISGSGWGWGEGDAELYMIAWGKPSRSSTNQ